MVDLVCIVAALFFFTSNLLSIIAQVVYGKNQTANYDAIKELDPTYLMDKWQNPDQISSRLFLASGIIKTLAWFTLLVPIMQMAWILSLGGKRKLGVHVLMAALALGGTLSELISRLMVIGSYNAAHFIARDFNLDDWAGNGSNDGTGWRVLEIVNIIVEGLILWIDAFEWLALFVIFSCIYYSIDSMKDEKRPFGLWLARLGLLVGILSLFDFCANVLRFESWSAFSKFAVSTSVVNTLVFMPMWLIMLACQMPGAQPNFQDDDETEEEAFVEKGNLHPRRPTMPIT